MAFLGVYKAIYDYAPQSDGELEISEGDLLYVLEKSDDDDWWKAKKKASAEDEDEPVGLIPANYIEVVSCLGSVPLGTAPRRETCRPLTVVIIGSVHRESTRPVRVHQTDRRRTLLS